MENGFSTSDAVLTAAMSGGGFGNNRGGGGMGDWGGGGYGYGAGREFASDASNAVRINASERSNDKGQDFISQKIDANADRNRWQPLGNNRREFSGHEEID